MKTGERFKDGRAVDDRHGAAARRRAVLRSRTSTATMPTERAIRETAEELYRARRMDVLLRAAAAGEHGLDARARASTTTTTRGYNEAMILYILALGSPTHPVGPAAWDAYTKTYTLGRRTTASSTSSSRRCSDISTRTSGSTSAASRTSTCAARASTTSRTRAAPRWRNAPTRSPIRWSGAATARTSGASPPATARSTPR